LGAGVRCAEKGEKRAEMQGRERGEAEEVKGDVKN
jgi:hypothetical protein